MKFQIFSVCGAAAVHSAEYLSSNVVLIDKGQICRVERRGVVSLKPALWVYLAFSLVDCRIEHI